MTGGDMPIRGKVARILNSRELALNIGSDDGVQRGMKFDVLTPKGENIKDPDTGETLGSLKRPKVRVRVTAVQDKLSVARTYKKRRVNVGGTGGLALPDLSKAFMPPEWVTKYETLKTDEATWEDLDESESFVKSGDPVVQVIEEEEGGTFPSATPDVRNCPICKEEIGPLEETVVRPSDSQAVHKRCHEEGLSVEETDAETSD